MTLIPVIVECGNVDESNHIPDVCHPLRTEELCDFKTRIDEFTYSEIFSLFNSHICYY